MIRSYPICFRVTLIRPLQPAGVASYFLNISSIGGLSHSPYPFLGSVSFPQIGDGLPNVTNVLSHNGAQHGYQHPIAGAGGRLENLGSRFCSEYGPIRVFKERGTGCLLHSHVPMNLLYLQYRFPGRSPSLGQAFLQDRMIQSLRE